MQEPSGWFAGVKAWVLHLMAAHYWYAAVAIAAALIALVRMLLLRSVHSKHTAVQPTAGTGNMSTATSSTAAAAAAESQPIADSEHSAAAAGTALASEAMSVMLQQQYLPQELWCVSRAVHAAVKNAVPVNVSITAETPTATALALLLRNAVQHVHISGFDLPDLTVQALLSVIGYHGYMKSRTAHPRAARWQCPSSALEDLAEDTLAAIANTLSPDVHTVRVTMTQPDVDVSVHSAALPALGRST